MRNLLLSTAIGDISGKPYESRRIRTKDFVDCLKLAISLGGDSDTLVAISAPIAYAHYRVIPEALLDNARKKLPQWMLELSESFDDYIIREIVSC